MLLELVTPNLLTGRSSDIANTLAQLLVVEREAWGTDTGELTASDAKIRRRIESFPEGVTLGSIQTVDGEWESVGSQFAFRFNWTGDIPSLSSWEEYTASGWTDRVHEPRGDTGFLVGVGVRPQFRKVEFWHRGTWSKPMRASMLLIAETLHKLFALRVQRVIANARVPHYHLRPDLSVDAFCSLRRADGLLFDPVLRFHERMGARILKPVAHSMHDPESCNAGCWVIYERPYTG